MVDLIWKAVAVGGNFLNLDLFLTTKMYFLLSKPSNRPTNECTYFLGIVFVFSLEYCHSLLVSQFLLDFDGNIWENLRDNMSVCQPDYAMTHISWALLKGCSISQGKTYYMEMALAEVWTAELLWFFQRKSHHNYRFEPLNCEYLWV